MPNSLTVYNIFQSETLTTGVWLITNVMSVGAYLTYAYAGYLQIFGFGLGVCTTSTTNPASGTGYVYNTYLTSGNSPLYIDPGNGSTWPVVNATCVVTVTSPTILYSNVLGYFYKAPFGFPTSNIPYITGGYMTWTRIA